MHDVTIKMWCAIQGFRMETRSAILSASLFDRSVKNCQYVKYHIKNELSYDIANWLGEHSLARYAKAFGALHTARAAVLGKRISTTPTTIVKTSLLAMFAETLLLYLLYMKTVGSTPSSTLTR